MESIRLSNLNRDVRVGDFYNYHIDTILPSKLCFGFSEIGNKCDA